MDVVNIVTTYGVAALAVIAFVVSIITEVIKDIGFLKRVPTNLVVIVLSTVVVIVAYFAAIVYLNHAFIWYEFIVAILSSFIVAFVAMNGWDKLHEIWTRFKK